jgi:hypothetical protein
VCSSDLGEPERLTTPDSDQEELGHIWPSIIPGRRAVLFTIRERTGSALANGQLAVLDLETLEVRRLGVAGVSPRYLSTGHLVYAVEDGTIRAVPFDLRALEVAGSPVPLLEEIVVESSGAATFDGLERRATRVRSG